MSRAYLPQVFVCSVVAVSNSNSMLFGISRVAYATLCIRQKVLERAINGVTAEVHSFNE